MSLNEIGCTTPFGKSLDKVCTDQEKAKKALKIYENGFTNTSCLYPCKHLASFTLTVDTVEDENEVRPLPIFFKKYLPVNTSKCSYTLLDLYAALGGYMGLFLGISIFQIKDGFAFFIRKVLDFEK